MSQEYMYIKKTHKFSLISLWSANFKCLKWHKSVATLALSSQPKQGFAKVWVKTKPGSHMSCSWECKRMWGNEPSYSQMNSHLGSWSPNGFLNCYSAIAGVKTHWIMMFLISLEKLLEHKCLKWVYIIHLNTWNISYGQKKGRESNWQFDFRPIKV
jgi:hypothetical protein